MMTFTRGVAHGLAKPGLKRRAHTGTTVSFKNLQKLIFRQMSVISVCWTGKLWMHFVRCEKSNVTLKAYLAGLDIIKRNCFLIETREQ